MWCRVGVLLAVFLALVVVGCGSSASTPDENATPAASAVRETFQLLGSKPSPLPNRIARWVATFEPNFPWSSTREVPVKGEGSYWLAATGGKLCIVASVRQGVSETCNPLKLAARHGVDAVTISPGKIVFPILHARRIVGVAPRWARTAVIEDVNANTKVAVNDSGVFEVDDSSRNPPEGVSLEAAR
jgi:hypothetical protein